MNNNKKAINKLTLSTLKNKTKTLFMFVSIILVTFMIYIEGKANGSTITFTIYGKKKDPKRTVEFLSETTNIKESTESTVEDATLPAGQKVVQSYGHTGYSARLWKIVKVNGKQVSKKVFNTSTYMSTPTVYRVGTKKAEKRKTK